MKVLTGGTRAAFAGFFSSHIVFTLALDGQALAGQVYPQILQDFNYWYVTTFKDPLMSPPSPLWIQSLIVTELVFQLPFFFVACYFLCYFVPVAGSGYPDWFRSACIAYGAHTSTTLVPILATLATNTLATPAERCMLTAVYLPYLIFPFWFMCIAIFSGSSDKTSESKKSKVY